jgi:hypothetical protein
MRDFKYAFVDEFTSFDEDSQEKIAKLLSKHKQQMITSIPGKRKITEDAILIKEGRIVDSYDEDAEEDKVEVIF